MKSLWRNVKNTKHSSALGKDEISTDGKISNLKIVGDNPIMLPEEDTIGRTSFVKSFVQQILSLDTDTGNVVGVLGAWGSGKTSFINLAKNELVHSNIAIIEFNPWMFSGTEQLMQSFFTELSAQLRLRPELAEVGEAIEKYGNLFSGMGWIPLIGPWLERGHKASKVVSQILQGHKEGASEQRKKIEETLARLNKRIVVIIDDIDRLSTSEIRDVFKLVRLTACFPNIIYIVAFDRLRVEKALDIDGISGRDYLEKILQVAIDLPPIPYQILSTQLLTAIEGALNGIEVTGPFDKQIWPDIFMEIIRPLIKTMRDVRRYAVNIRNTVSSLGGEVALPDTLALEAIRIFMPDVFVLLHPSIDALTTTSNSFSSYQNESEALKTKIEKIIDSSKENEEVLRAVMMRLFPAAHGNIENISYGSEWMRDWLFNRRVAHKDILHLYFEHSVGESLKAFLSAEKAWLFMDNRDLLDEYLHSSNITEVAEIISSLENYQDQYRAEHVEPTSIVLLNLLPELPKERKGLFDFDAHLKVIRVVYHLVRSLKEPGLIETAVKSILTQVKTLSAKNQLIQLIGYTEGQGHKLVTEEAAKLFELNWAHDVKEALDDDLLKEYDLLMVLLKARELLNEIGEDMSISTRPEVTLAILTSAQSITMSQGSDTRIVNKELHLVWGGLVRLFGDEATLAQRIKQAEVMITDENRELFELADKYIDGWRPESF